MQVLLTGGIKLSNLVAHLFDVDTIELLDIDVSLLADAKISGASKKETGGKLTLNIVNIEVKTILLNSIKADANISSLLNLLFAIDNDEALICLTNFIIQNEINFPMKLDSINIPINKLLPEINH